jgi:hypothetical protein
MKERNKNDINRGDNGQRKGSERDKLHQQQQQQQYHQHPHLGELQVKSSRGKE